MHSRREASGAGELGRLIVAQCGEGGAGVDSAIVRRAEWLRAPLWYAVAAAERAERASCFSFSR